MCGQEAKRHPEIDRDCAFNKAKREREDCAGEKRTACKPWLFAAKQEIGEERHEEEKVNPPWMSEGPEVCHNIFSLAESCQTILSSRLESEICVRIFGPTSRNLPTSTPETPQFISTENDAPLRIVFCSL